MFDVCANNVHITIPSSHLPKRCVFVVFFIAKKGHMHKCQHFDGSLQLLGLSQQPQSNQWFFRGGGGIGREHPLGSHNNKNVFGLQTRHRTNLNKKHNPPPSFQRINRLRKRYICFINLRETPKIAGQKNTNCNHPLQRHHLWPAFWCKGKWSVKSSSTKKGAIEKTSFITKSQQNISGSRDESTEMFRSPTLITFQ